FLALLREHEQELIGQQIAAAKLLTREMPDARAELDELLRAHPSPALRDWWTQRGGTRARSEATLRMEKAGIELVRIPAGRFWMGSPNNEEGRLDWEGPRRQVVLAEFWLAATPVTNAQYGRFVAANPAVDKPTYWADRRFNQPEQPVVGISWDDAMAFCAWAGLVLPTEAQWEYACRAGTTTCYWSGDAESDLAQVSWYLGNSNARLHAVGEKQANAFGLFDMHGNVFEWCLDEFADYAIDPRPGDGLRCKPVAGGNRVIRGGGWLHIAHLARSAYRGRSHPGASSDFLLGFRPAQAIS
ncbi:MAG TPA: formylglycine-generating enzyme family protein, partial [Enhygromyxa sp.]|nr:formylglycine-generating enzyme family protein [Enhygromyxa sp.]